MVSQDANNVNTRPYPMRLGMKVKISVFLIGDFFSSVILSLPFPGIFMISIEDSRNC